MIVQIVPHLPPPYEGLGGNAEVLASALGKLGVTSSFVAAGSLPSRRPADLIAAVEAAGDRVVLHYAGYGYQRRGCPVGLVRGVLGWRRRGAGRRLVTLFHEVAASGPPWRSSFWLRPLQRRLATALSRGSDGLVTPLPLYAGLLRRWSAGREVTVLPVVSNVGEPTAVPALGERERRIVVFGGGGVRQRAYGTHLPVLEEAIRTLGATEVLDIGLPIPLPATAGGVPIRALGSLPAAEVSGLLLGSAAGFMAYPPAFLSKSGIFAAYCAHGMLPVCAWDGAPAADRHYWDGVPTNADDFQAVADAARAWYLEHSSQRQAEAFLRLVLDGGPR